MSIRVINKDKWTAEGRSHNYGFSPKSSLWSAVGFQEKLKLIRLNGYPKTYPMVARTPIVNRWPPRVGLDSEFPSPRSPAHDRQGLALSGRYSRQFWSTAAYWLFAANLYICMHTHTYAYTHARTHMHIHRQSGYPPPADAPHRRCRLLAQTLKLINRKSNLK